MEHCLEALEPPASSRDLAPFSFMLAVLDKGRAAAALCSYFEKCRFVPWHTALDKQASEYPVPFLGGASVVCENCLNVDPATWKPFVNQQQQQQQQYPSATQASHADTTEDGATS